MAFVGGLTVSGSRRLHIDLFPSPQSSAYVSERSKSAASTRKFDFTQDWITGNYCDFVEDFKNINLLFY
jgi:hypothetical protein